MLSSPPMMPVAGETSLARIQSQPFFLSFAWAWARTSSVSAAKPMTRLGRPDLRCAIVARMSGFSTSSSVGGPLPPFLILPALTCRGRQSATAAANTATSAGSAFSTASSICCAVSTRTTETPGGSGSVTGPLTSATSAPAAAAAAAMAWPCFPDERLAMKRTGSIGSLVGPEVTEHALARQAAPSPCKIASAAATISFGSAMRPTPASPRSAISPLFGPTMRTPSVLSCARLRCVAFAAHMCGFIAGAIRTGLSVASRTAVARSSAWPPAIFAMRSAVAGATTIEVGVAGEADMADVELALRVEQVGVGALAAERAGRERRDEVLRRAGEDAAHPRAAVLQPPDQVERLVGGDAAADDEEDAPVGQHAAPHLTHGSTSGTSQSRKCDTLRVATVISFALAMAAICESRVPTRRPSLLRRAAISAKCKAARSSNGRIRPRKSSLNISSARLMRCLFFRPSSPECNSIPNFGAVKRRCEHVVLGNGSTHSRTTLAPSTFMSSESTFVSRINIYLNFGGLRMRSRGNGSSERPPRSRKAPADGGAQSCFLGCGRAHRGRQQTARLFLHRAAVLGRSHAQICFNSIIEIANSQVSHAHLIHLNIGTASPQDKH